MVVAAAAAAAVVVVLLLPKLLGLQRVARPARALDACTRGRRICSDGGRSGDDHAAREK